MIRLNNNSAANDISVKKNHQQFFSHTTHYRACRKCVALGNDIVVIVFQDGTTPFDVSSMRSEFNHVWYALYLPTRAFCVFSRIDVDLCLCLSVGLFVFRRCVVQPLKV